jgi:hypothetical protein
MVVSHLPVRFCRLRLRRYRRMANICKQSLELYLDLPLT